MQKTETDNARMSDICTLTDPTNMPATRSAVVAVQVRREAKRHVAFQDILIGVIPDLQSVSRMWLSVVLSTCWPEKK